MNAYQKMYGLLTQVIPESVLNDRAVEYAKSKSGGFMDLSYDVLTREDGTMRIALAHNFEMNGDLVPDPDMEIKVDTKNRTVEAMTFQDQYGYKRVYDDRGNADVRLKSSLNDFLATWLQNLINQGHGIKPKAKKAEVAPAEAPKVDIRCHNAQHAAMEVMMEECGGEKVRLVYYSDNVVMAVPEKVYMNLGKQEARNWIDTELRKITPYAHVMFGKVSWEHLIDYAECIIYSAIAMQIPHGYGTITGKRGILKDRKCDMGHTEERYVLVEQSDLPHPIIRCSRGHIQMFVQDFKDDVKVA